MNEKILISLVNDFLRPFRIKSDFDSDFFYDPDEEKIYFSIIYSERSDELFKKYVEKKFDFKIPSLFMISLLHEVGHFYTLNTFSKMEIVKDHLAKNIIEKKLKRINPNTEKYNKIYSKYFDLKTERVATAWAVWYYKNNKTRCDNFYSVFSNALSKQYSKLGLI